MKIKLKLSIAALMLMLAAVCLPTQKISAQDDGFYDDQYNNDQYNQQQDEPVIDPEADVNFNDFYSDLSPYGNWFDYPGYGRVWVYRDRNFVPYSTGGHWAYTNFGWTWASDFDWGWAPFHYGRWSFDNRYGWFWVPGYEWGPAWVNWRTGGDYYGWAPIQPGVSINISFGFGSGIPADRWMFVPCRYIASPYFHNYIVPRSRNNIIVRNTTIIKNVNVYRNTRYVTGPDRRDVERYTGRRITQQRVVVDNRPGPTRIVDNSVHIYRPTRNNNVTINRNNNNNNNNNRVQPPANNGNRINQFNRNNKDNVIPGGSFNNENDNKNEGRKNRDNNIDNNIRRDQPLNRVVTPPQNNGDNNDRRNSRPELNNNQRPNDRNLNQQPDNNSILRRRQNDNTDNNNLQPQRSYTPPANFNRGNINNQADSRRQREFQPSAPAQQPQFNRNVAPPQQRQWSFNNQQQNNTRRGERRN